MANNVRVPRLPEMLQAPVPPETRPHGWRWWRGHVSITCPKGHTATYNRAPGGHVIAADGKVTPSTVCPTKGCGWHEWVTLDGWTAQDASAPAI